MKNIKKLTVILLAICMLVFAACNTGVTDNNSDSNLGEEQKREYTFVMPDGAPSLAAVSLMKNYQQIDGHKVNYKIVPAENIATEFITGADIAIMPTNASAKLFNKGVDLKLLSVNVFGVLYMIGKQPIASLNDLKGKVVYNIGEGGTPDLLLKYFLESANVEYVESTVSVSGKVALAYASSAQEVMVNIAQNRAEYGVMGQPVVTNANNNLSTQIVLDFQQEWQKLNSNGSYPQAGVVVKGNIATDTSFVQALYQAMQLNGDYLLQNPGEIKGVLEQFNSSLTFNFTKEVVQACNIGCKSASEVKPALVEYFTNIMQFDSSFIGGNLPSDNYYLNF